MFFFQDGGVAAVIFASVLPWRAFPEPSLSVRRVFVARMNNVSFISCQFSQQTVVLIKAAALI